MKFTFYLSYGSLPTVAKQKRYLDEITMFLTWSNSYEIVVYQMTMEGCPFDQILKIVTETKKEK